MTGRATFEESGRSQQFHGSFISAPLLNPSTESLLSSDTGFQFTKRKFRISPYDVVDTPFQDLSPSMLIESCPTSPRSMSPPNDVSIDNFNPKSRIREFTDPLTIEAIENLGFRQSDLFYPTSAELDRIAGDRTFYKERLIERAHKFADEVRAERMRILQQRFCDDLEEEDQKEIEVTTRTLKCSPPRPRYGSRIKSELSESDRKMQMVHNRAREIGEREIEAKRMLVENREKRHERLLKDLELEKQRETEMYKEMNEEKRQRSLLFNQRMREEQAKRVMEFEHRKRSSTSLTLIGDKSQIVNNANRVSKTRHASPTGRRCLSSISVVGKALASPSKTFL